MKSTLLHFAIALGSIFVSDLPAQNWQIASYNDLPTDYEFQSVSVVSEQVMWTVADSLYDNSQPIPGNHRPIVMHTTNGGLSWTNQFLTAAIGRRAVNIIGLNANTALVSTRNPGSERFVFKTVDGGISWQQINPPTLSGGLALHFFDAQHGLAVNRNYIATTDDAGNSWTEIPAANIPALGANERNLFFNAGNFSAQVGDRVWLGTSAGRVMRTLDRGHHWEIYQAAGLSENIISVAFSDSLHGVAVVPGTDTSFYETSKLFNTADGGVHWTEMPSAPMGLVSTAVAVPGITGQYFIGDHLYAPAGSAYQVGLNTNNLAPSAWNIQIDSFPVNAGRFISATAGYLAGYSVKDSDTKIINGISNYVNVIYKWKGALTSSEEPALAVPIKLQLSPNPATDRVSITCADQEFLQQAKLSVLDANGRMVCPEMPYAGSLDVKGWAPGIYFIEITSVGQKALASFIKN